MLSQSVGYAGCALACAATMGGKPVLVREIAKVCDIPPAYLAKIIHTLGRRGLVRTQRGVGGGVVLARSPDEITLHDLCVALDDPVVDNRCMLGPHECSDDRGCPAHCFWKEHREREVAFLRETTIADLAAFETRRRWHAASTRDAAAGD